MKNLFDAFISYGRADSKAFATKLHARLLEVGLKVWFDQNDIPLGVDFQNQIDDGIEKAHNFIFLIAPHSVKSAYCLKEIQLAVKRNKHIIPLLHVEPSDCWDKMHPTIGKINWVYFREEQDDFEAAFAGLISLIRSQTDYVQQHTQILVKALEWERNQKQNSCLLIGEERQKAESWLKIRFKDAQPPCVPTDLHCEFISESTKNANNLMTQVFLGYSDKDKEVMKKLAKTLRREGLTVWVNKTDIKTGTEFQEEVNKGIEGADNVVCLISPAALQSWYWQQEVAHAFANNKRIIPLLIEPTALDSIHPNIRALQFIDFTTHQDEAKYRDDADKLIKILHQDECYYEEHKILLVKALKWQEQNRNRSILLRGHNLQYYEDWLKVHRHRSEHPPLRLQVEFITSSSNQLPESSLEVFISYSRADSDFARKLNEALQIQGKTTWFDQESIPPGSDFQQEIYRGIESSANFLFIISPRSVNSPYCADEVEYARKLNKRLVTVLHTEVSAKELHPALASVQWIDFNRYGGDFSPNFSELVRTLDTDREYVKSHTKWSQRALEWEEKGKSADLLLRGSELTIAANWLQETELNNKKPQATDLQKTFITASEEFRACLLRQEEERRQRELETARKIVEESEARRKAEKKARKQLTFGLVVVSILAVAAGVGLWQTEQQRKQVIDALLTSSQELFASGKEIEARIATINAGKQLKQAAFWLNLDSQRIQATSLLLQQAVYEVREYNRLEKHTNTVTSVSFSPDGKTLASASADTTIKLWDVATGKEKTTLKGHSKPVWSISFSPDGKTLASASDDKTIKLWDVATGKLKTTLKGHSKEVYSVSFSPDGKTLASSSADTTIKLWDVATGKEKTTLKGHSMSVWSISFSPDGKTLASASWDKTIKLWDVATGKLKTIFKEHSKPVWSISFSPDGKTLASASDDKTIKLWDVATGKLETTLSGHSDSVYSVSFSQDGKTLASASVDNSIKLWDVVTSKQKITLSGHINQVISVSFSTDGKTLASASKDKTIKLWDVATGKLKTTLKGHSDDVYSVSFSPDGKTLASASWDKTIKLWDVATGKLKTTLKGHSDEVWSITFNRNGKTLASASVDKTIKLWDVATGKLKTTLKGHSDEVYSVSFSPDSKTLASSSADTTIKLWDVATGKLKTTISGHSQSVNSVSFNPDGQTLVTASSDKTIKVWDVATGKEKTTLFGHSKPINSVSFSPDGKILASASNDKTVILWHLNSILSDLDFDSLLRRDCDWISGYLAINSHVSEREHTLCDKIGTHK